MSKKTKIVTYVTSLFIFFVFIQSLFFKFTDAPETQYIFGTLDQWANDVFGAPGLFLAPGIFNAYVIGTIELISSLLLLGGLITKSKFLTPIGALMSMGVMTGAIFFHLFTPLGIVVQDDGGTLFGMAIGIWVASTTLIVLHKNHLINLFCNLFCSKSNA